jgi:hypothetical protein
MEPGCPYGAQSTGFAVIGGVMAKPAAAFLAASYLPNVIHTARQQGLLARSLCARVEDQVSNLTSLFQSSVCFKQQVS